jgi:hypothetical protein
LPELEPDVSSELDIAQTSQPQELPDPDGDRYEIRLRGLLSAVEALEEG